jgi:hypothetical protein
MTKTFRERRHLTVPMRWPQAGNDPSRPSRGAQRSLSSLTSSQRSPRRPSPVSGLSMQIRQPHSAGITSIPEFSASIKSP